MSSPSAVDAQVFCILEHHLKVMREKKRGTGECYDKKFYSVLRAGDSIQLGDFEKFLLPLAAIRGIFLF